MRFIRMAAVAIAVVLSVTSCSSGEIEVTYEPSWTRVKGTAAPDDALVWVVGNTIHVRTDDHKSRLSLMDGEIVEPTTTGFVVADGGLFTVDVDEGQREHSTSMMSVLQPGVTIGIGTFVDPTTLRTSPNGQYLAFIDPKSSDEENADGTPVAQAVVVDLHAREEILRSTDGMQVDGTDESTAPSIEAVTDEAAYVTTPGGSYTVDLATAEVTDVAGDQPLNPDQRGPRGLWNPTHTWAIADTTRAPARLVSADGEAVETGVPGGGPVTLFAWVDDDTALGWRARTDDPATDVPLVTCEVPSGTCEVVPESAGALLPVDLQPRR